MPNINDQNQKIQNVEIEIDALLKEGMNLIEGRHFASAFMTFNAVLKQRYDYFEIKNRGLVEPLTSHREPGLAGEFLKHKIGKTKISPRTLNPFPRTLNPFPGILNPFYTECIALFGQTDNKYVSTLIRLYEESSETDMDRNRDIGRNPSIPTYFQRFKIANENFNRAIQTKDHQNYHLFSFLHYRCRNYLVHNNKRKSDPRDSQIVEHMALLMEQYATILKTPPKS